MALLFRNWYEHYCRCSHFFLKSKPVAMAAIILQDHADVSRPKTILNVEGKPNLFSFFLPSTLFGHVNTMDYLSICSKLRIRWFEPHEGRPCYKINHLMTKDRRERK